MIWPVPIALMQFLAQMVAAPWINDDMEVAVGARDNQNPFWRFVHRVKMVIVVVGGLLTMTTIAWICIESKKATALPVIRPPVWPCETASLPKCMQIGGNLTDGSMAVYGTNSYGLNRFNMSTTARSNCYSEMEKRAGNTFAHKKGQCQIFNCSRKEDLIPDWDNKTSDGWFVYSNVKAMCPYTTKAGSQVVAAHLFEWNWADVGKECQNYLGPAGFNVVQVSPPTEHILGTSWTTRYQPVSYLLNSRSGTQQEFIQMVGACYNAGVSVMVDVVVNHMATTFYEAGKQCHGDECVGFNGTIFGSRMFSGTKRHSPPDASDEMAVYTSPNSFHHLPADFTSNCGWPPYSNDRYLCDMNSLPDINTENLQSQQMLLRYLFGLFEIGVTHVRVDAASNMYASSLNGFLNRIPWDYVVQEYYGIDLSLQTDAMDLGHVTDFDFGLNMAKQGAIFDAWNPDAGTWWDTKDKFSMLLNLRDVPRYPHGLGPPENHGLIFLSNHDLQRERWKECPPLGPACPDAYCTNPDDFTSEGNKCAPIYKHGQQYNLAQHFMLAFPYSLGFRLISSYAFDSFSQGPPLADPDGSPNKSTSRSVWKPGQRDFKGYPDLCKRTPEESPVNYTSWENDSETPWVCEHRWEGVAGMVRFRRAIANESWANVHQLFDDREGHFGYIIGSRSDLKDVRAFVALSRGFSKYTQHGPNSTLSLHNLSLRVGLPAGSYCNMASLSQPLVSEDDAKRCRQNDTIQVDVNHTIAYGLLASGKMVAIHRRYIFDQPSCGPGAQSEECLRL
jgi:hypothetical protein